MKNSKIKNFDTAMGQFINEHLAGGIEISTAVIVLEKYLINARDVEKEIIESELKEQQETQMTNVMPEMESAPIFEEDNVQSSVEDVVDIKEPEKEYIGYGENKNDPDMDPDWDIK